MAPRHRLRLSATGESSWLATGVDKELFEDTIALFAREAGAGRNRIIMLVLDGAGWHTAPLALPEGIRLVHPPPHTPELQPAETLWVYVDEPIVNKHFDTLAHLDAVVAERYVSPSPPTATSSVARPDSTGGPTASPRTDQTEMVLEGTGDSYNQHPERGQWAPLILRKINELRTKIKTAMRKMHSAASAVIGKKSSERTKAWLVISPESGYEHQHIR